MRLLFIADSTSIHTRRWVCHFAEQGHETHIITLGRKRERLPGVHHVANFAEFYYLRPAFPLVLLRVRRLVRRIRPDILHGHFLHQYGWLAALCGVHPLVLTAWGTDILGLPGASRSGIGTRLTRYALRRADLLTATSAHLKTEMVRLGATADRVHVVFWGVDPAAFRPDIHTHETRTRLAIAPDAPIILSNRNQAPLYNNDTVLRAMQRVLSDVPQAVLVLQNSGGTGEADLRRLTSELGITASVRFLPQMRHEELPPLYALADVYVSVPSWDAGPVSLKEAMASHATPIISRLPGPMEWIQDGVNGRVVPVRDVDALARAMTDLLRDAGTREAFNRTNRRLIVDRADHRTCMAAVDALYRLLLSAGGGSA
jgi:glycosyltransferase involved in cell wall biosynthesis